MSCFFFFFLLETKGKNIVKQKLMQNGNKEEKDSSDNTQKSPSGPA